MDISIIIPNYNRKERLKRCLETLLVQDYPKENFEIIVIDDGSSDGTDKMLGELSREHGNLRYFCQSHKGPATARNLGIKEAKGEIIGFTDSDCILKEDWVRKMTEAHWLEKSAIAIGGLTKVNSCRIKALVSQSLSDGAIKTNIDGESEIIFFPTCNVSLKKEYLNGERFNELFPLPAGEDLEFFWRLFKKGGNFIYRQDIEILHNCHPNFRSFLKQSYMYGRGNYLVKHIHNDHPLLKEIKTKNPVQFIFGLIINFIKIPRFSYLLGRRVINSYRHLSLYQKLQVHVYFTLHKIMYLIGNVLEYIRVYRMAQSKINNGKVNSVTNKPEFIILDITHRCNLKCNVCEIRKDRPIDEFTTQEVKNLINQAISWGVSEFVLSGGEPLVREDIFEILNFVKEKQYHVGILSNGILLTDEFIVRLSPYLIANNLSLSISLDALTPEIHDDIRGARGCFERTSKGLRRLSQLKGNHPNINFNVISIILDDNLGELLGLAEFLKSLNVNSVQFQPLLVNNLVMKERSNMARYWIPQDRLSVLDRVIDSLVVFKKNNPNLVVNSEQNLALVKKYFRGLLTQDDVRCLYAIKTMLIANNGDVTTCFDCYGNIRRNRLKDIWLSNEANRARQRVANCLRPCLLPCFCDL